MIERCSFLSAAVSLAMVAVAGGCGSTIGGPSGPAGTGPSGTDSDQADGSDGDANDGGVTLAAPGLPCEVAALLSTYCVACHGQKPSGGAPMSLVSYADLLGPAVVRKDLNNAEASLERMRSSVAPMPPGGAMPDAAALKAFADWVGSGSPKESCGDGATIIDPYATPTVCSSDIYWTRGDHESPRMHPGIACIDCHARGVSEEEEGEIERGPTFSLAGTVFPTAHEPDDCNGVNGSGGDVLIEVKDATGKVFRLRPNAAGNFYREDRDVTFPITARVLYDGRVREMLTPQNSGDCNSCHTEEGDDEVPGRIMLP